MAPPSPRKAGWSTGLSVPRQVVKRRTLGKWDGFGDRLKEHLRAPSPIYEHGQSYGHCISEHSLSIIGREVNGITRTIKEAMFKRVNDPSSNMNLGKFSCPTSGMRSCRTPGLPAQIMPTAATPQWADILFTLVSMVLPLGGVNFLDHSVFPPVSYINGAIYGKYSFKVKHFPLDLIKPCLIWLDESFSMI